jgi:hypothetical protein
MSHPVHGLAVSMPHDGVHALIERFCESNNA